jgi:16S rRNA (adenine1518-N6/adenine1519-N6)-dimethyltransferase
MPFASLPHPARDETMFGSVVARAFSQRRKTLRNTLKGVIADADFARLDINPGARAQELSVADFVRIADVVAAPV